MHAPGGTASDLPWGKFRDRTVYVIDVAKQEEDAQDLIFARVVTQLRERLEKEGISCGVINGKVSLNKRSEIVDHFQTRKDPHVLLIQPQAASHGLTLTAATHVIHLSRWWNPAVEDQCTDRAYRIGQARPEQ